MVKRNFVICVAVFLVFLLSGTAVLAEGFGTDYTPGANGTLAVQVFYGNGTAANGATVTANMYASNGTKVLDGVSLTYISGSQGIYTYNFVVPSEEGVYLVEYISSNPTGYSSSEVNVSEAAGGGANITSSDIEDIAEGVVGYHISDLEDSTTLGGLLNLNLGGETMTLLIIVIIGLTLFLASFRWKDLLLSYAAALTWLAIGFWWVIEGGPPGFETTQTWGPIITYVPFILSFVVFFRLMNTEIRHEASGKSWIEYGAPPKGATLTRAQEYRRELRRRLR